MKKQKIILLGATGSIGNQTLDVVLAHKDRLQLVALAAGSKVNELVSIANKFRVKHIAIGNKDCKNAPILNSLDDVEYDFGLDAISSLVRNTDADIVLNAMSGAAGLKASYETLKCGKVLALANKESLVVGGDIIMPLATHETLLPVDSEHSAIYQCYLGEHTNEAKKIWLTASGGPFRGFSRKQLSCVNVKQALAHPTWNMGPKITIDSATLMNKGLEVIEACHLFNLRCDDIQVVVHPQSCIHSMVEYVDGSIKAHLGVADMRIPIQFALSYPHRWESPTKEIDFAKIHPLEFFDPDLDTFKCLKLALDACRAGGTLPCVMNAANEVAVASFLQGACTLTDIDACVERCIEHFENSSVESIEQLEEIDKLTRTFALDALRL